MKPLLIGQAPGPATDPGRPLSGRCGARLADLCGLELESFLNRFERVNLIETFPGKAGKGDAFPIEQARLGAVRLMTSGRLFCRRTVFLGGNVWRAFGWPGEIAKVPLFKWAGGMQPMMMAFAPHPSGVSRWWNDPANEERARRFFRRLALESAPRP